jgi:hypothetical protein
MVLKVGAWTGRDGESGRDKCKVPQAAKTEKHLNSVPSLNNLSENTLHFFSIIFAPPPPPLSK